MNRSKAREAAFKLLYQIEIQKEVNKEDIKLFFENNVINSIEAKEYIEDNIQEGAQVLGIHLEGPYIAKKCMGAQLPNYIIKPDIDSFKHFEEVSGNNIKLVSIAPEEGPMEFIDYLKSKNIDKIRIYIDKNNEKNIVMDYEAIERGEE